MYQFFEQASIVERISEKDKDSDVAVFVIKQSHAPLKMIMLGAIFFSITFYYFWKIAASHDDQKQIFEIIFVFENFGEFVAICLVFPLAVFWLIWVLWGIESIIISSDHLFLSKSIFGISFGKSYEWYSIFRPSFIKEDPQKHYQDTYSAIEFRRLSFIYEGRSIRFGFGLDESDALEIISQITARLNDENYLGAR